MTPRQYADRLEHQVAQLETEAGPRLGGAGIARDSRPP
jgi:hypothetical protein